VRYRIYFSYCLVLVGALYTKEVSLFHLKMPSSRKFCEQNMVFKTAYAKTIFDDFPFQF
jgi:hypothetical protein